MKDWNREYSQLLSLPRASLLLHLTETLIELASLYQSIAECKSSEAMKDPNMNVAKAERYNMEGVRDGLLDKKAFILLLIGLGRE